MSKKNMIIAAYFAIAVTIVFPLVVLLCQLLWCLFAPKAEPFDDSDLIPKISQTNSSKENAWTIFERGYAAEEKSRRKKELRLKRYKEEKINQGREKGEFSWSSNMETLTVHLADDPTAWDSAAAQIILDGENPPIRLLRHAEAYDWSVDFTDKDSYLRFDTICTNLVYCTFPEAKILLRLKLESGDFAGTLALWKDLFPARRIIEELAYADDPVETASITDDETINRIANNPSFTKTVATEMLQILENAERNQQDLINKLPEPQIHKAKLEYLGLKYTTDDEVRDFAKTNAENWNFSFWKFDRNATLKEAAEICRKQISVIQTTGVMTDIPAQKVYVFDKNGIGKTFLNSHYKHFPPDPFIVVEIIRQRLTCIRLARIAVACHIYRLEHGKFPPNPVALIPAYMKELPEDPLEIGKNSFLFDIENGEICTISSNAFGRRFSFCKDPSVFKLSKDTTNPSSK